MANGIHLSQTGKVRGRKQKIEQKDLAVASAKYVQNFTIAVDFTNGKTKLIDFIPLFHKHVKGNNLKYFLPQKFQKFIVKNGNIYWGKNEDVIFPVEDIYRQNKKREKEEILYIL
jgi:hypothetical protein